MFIFHQASDLVLDNLIRLLELPSLKVVRHLEKIGNTVSSTIPIAYELERRAGRIQPGMTILLMGFGVGGLGAPLAGILPTEFITYLVFAMISFGAAILGGILWMIDRQSQHSAPSTP